MVAEKVIFSHDDRSVRPIVLVKTEGPVFMQSAVQQIMIAMYDFKNMEFPRNVLDDEKLFTKIELNLHFAPLEASYRTVAKDIVLIPSSEISYELTSEDNSQVKLTQNFQIMTHNI